MLLPSDVKDMLLMVGILRQKGVKKIFTFNHSYKKKAKTLCSLVKKYKINTKYFTPMGLTYFKLTDFEPYWGKFKVIKKKKWSSRLRLYPKNSKGDLFTVYSDDNSSNNNHSTEYGYSSTDCKLKNIINIKNLLITKNFLKS